MSLTFDISRDELPINMTLLTILNEVCAHFPCDLTSATGLTFTFQHTAYSTTSGREHPIEIRIIRHLNKWQFDYITDCSFHGSGPYAEVCKELDFNLQTHAYFILGFGPLRLQEVQEIFRLWQTHFIIHYKLGAYRISVVA